MSPNDNVIPLEKWNNHFRREEVLRRRRRIRRPGGLSETLQYELEKPRKYPHRLNVLPGYEVVYRRGNWRKLETPQCEGAEPDEEAHVRIRETFCLVRLADRPVAAVAFQEIDAELVDPWCFWTAMDDESDQLQRLANVIAGGWEDADHYIFGYGPVLELTHVWVEPRHPRRGIWKPVVSALIERMMPGHSVFMAHAFPLEYSGLVEDGAATEPAFNRRQAAMMRVCERFLGLRPLPAEEDDHGYMWRPRADLSEIIPSPAYDANWPNRD